MVVLSILFIVVIALPLLVTIPPKFQTALETLDWVIWSAFALELCVKTYLSPRRGQYLRTHWYEVITVVIPFLRPLRLVRSLRLLRLLGLTRLTSVSFEIATSGRFVL